jgi:hypothetical protein
MIKPAPLFRSDVQCAKCQSVAKPSWAEYWHMGATTMRLASFKGPLGEGSANSEKSKLMWFRYVVLIERLGVKATEALNKNSRSILSMQRAFQYKIIATLKDLTHVDSIVTR